jgi:hypothetical protein
MVNKVVRPSYQVYHLIRHIRTARDLKGHVPEGRKTEMSENKTVLTLNAFRIPQVIHT